MINNIKNYVITLYPALSAKLYVYIRNTILPPNLLECYISKKGRIIDVGCGFGSYAIYFALKEPKRNILGIDSNRKRVRTANKASKNITNVTFEARDLKTDHKLKSADGIYLIDILHHLPYKNQELLLKECYKRIKNGGTLIIKEISNKPLWKYWFNYLHDKIMTKNDKLYFQNSKKLVGLLKQIGFKIKIRKLNAKSINPYPHIIFLCKK